MQNKSIKLAIKVFLLFSIFIINTSLNIDLLSKPLSSGLIYSSYLYRNDGTTTLVGDLLLDSKGNPIILGTTSEPGLPFTKDAFKTKLDSIGKSKVYNGYLLKQNKDSYQIEQLTSLGISNLGIFNAVMAIDKEDNIYVAILQDTINSILSDVDFNTHKSILLLKMNPDFSKLLASTYFGNDLGKNKSIIHLYDMKLDKKGNVILTGTCDPNGIKTTIESYQPTNLKASYTAFVTKFSPDYKELLFSTYISGIDTKYDTLSKAFSEVVAIGIGRDNEIILAGRSNFKDFPFINEKIDVSNENILEYTNYTKGFITIINESGNRLMNSIYNTKSLDCVYCGNEDMVVGEDGNIYVTGDINNSSVITYSNVLQPNYAINWQRAGYIQSYSIPDLILKKSTYFSNDKCHPYSMKIGVGKSSDIYLCGLFSLFGKTENDKLNPPITTKGAYQFEILPVNSYTQEYNLERMGSFLTVFNKDLNQLKYSTTFGGSDAIGFLNMILDSNENLYVTGYAAGAIYFPITENALWKTYYPYNQFISVFSNFKDQVSVDGFKIAPSNIFPNPANEYLNISFESTKEGIGKIEIIDLLGKTVCSFENFIIEGNNSIKYSELSTLPTATYTIKVTMNNEIVSIGKFIKQ